MVRRYHIYKDIWTAVVGEEFQCQREGRNQFNLFTVAVMRDISHVPRKFLSVCSTFCVGVVPLQAV